MTMLKQLWPEISALCLLASDQYHGQISAFIAAHPMVAAAVAFVAALAARFAPPPTSAPKA